MADALHRHFALPKPEVVPSRVAGRCTCDCQPVEILETIAFSTSRSATVEVADRAGQAATPVNQSPSGMRQATWVMQCRVTRRFAWGAAKLRFHPRIVTTTRGSGLIPRARIRSWSPRRQTLTVSAEQACGLGLLKTSEVESFEGKGFPVEADGFLRKRAE
jgi:hypothetical protein